MFAFNCVATGNEVKDGPVNASPKTQMGKSALMNNNPVNGLSSSGLPENNCVTNLEICCRPPTVIVLTPIVTPFWLLSVSSTVATDDGRS